ncbi:MAG: oligopeptide transporter, OPT family [uncultured Chthoniobacterales bacterium]|uniref:Oligopeptide transporter, OPT family n=1 Tax=uncultured Chthoniobacterales bacterium TaxID=1836801 RepID=A0A6J4IXG9_9BACT|nr:MAG: oligopeptide transporter, OPT family [uncultured Chthoniobacterales bacterium]
MQTPPTANPPNEMPDMVGAKPANPFLAVFKPFIPASAQIAEFTPVPLIVGTLLGMLFGASSLYLVLKVGLTVSASIPVAVISITIFRLFAKLRIRRDATILENNIVQTAGSAGESIAFGLGVTMPAIMILGFDLEIMRVMMVAVLGGLLGILMMIPLRRALIVEQHGLLKYPEGTACAEVLKAAAAKDPTGELSPDARRTLEQDESSGGGKIIFAGFGIGLLYQTAMGAFKAWKDVPEKVFGAPLKAGSIGAEISPALLGVGYIIGPRIASIMCAGGVLAYLVLIPAIKFFGEKSGVIIPPGTEPIGEMGPNDIRGAYVLYIGAGAVAAGGIISLFRSLPTIWHGLKGGLADIRGGQAAAANVPRTDQDLPMKFVLIGVLALIGLIMAVPQLNLQWNILGALLIVAFGFLFVTVSSRLTGEIGSSSNPISGMTVATLLLTCLVFLFIGWTAPNYFVTALSIGGIVCIASSNGGTTSQDLKTGFLVGATPRLQQIAILIGALASALVLGPILLKLNDSYTVYVPAMTFAPVPQDVARMDLGPTAATLPPFAEGIKPEPRNFTILKSEGGDQTQPIAGLGAGEYLVNDEGRIAYKVERHFAPDLRADPAQLGKTEKLHGVQGAGDQNAYRVWQRLDPAGGPAQKFLVNDQGVVTYLVDPGINGTQRFRPDGSAVTKFDAPKATLMSYIIKGILSRELPWALVLLGVFIAIVLEMSGIPSLAFAVGVYLPLSSSSPIFIGGMVRWLVDRYLRRNKFRGKNLTPEELVAEGDKSSGVLLASGYIAGGALAGIIIAFMAGVPALAGFSRAVEDWSATSNPFYHGPNADLLALIPFTILAVLLYLVGRDRILATRRTVTPAA